MRASWSRCRIRSNSRCAVAIPDVDFFDALFNFSAPSGLDIIIGGGIKAFDQPGREFTAFARGQTQRFGKELYACIVGAIEDAKARREFVAWMPVEDVALQLVSIANSAGPITQDAGDFDRLEQLYAAFTRIITHAFGPEAAAREGASARRKRPARHR